MKLLALALFSAAALFCLSGCATISKQLAKMPQVEADSIEFEITGRMTSTTGELKDVHRLDDGRLRAGEVELNHSNPWVQRLHFKGVNVVLPKPDKSP